jgi:hypothetical protein
MKWGVGLEGNDTGGLLMDFANTQEHLRLIWNVHFVLRGPHVLFIL